MMERPTPIVNRRATYGFLLFLVASGVAAPDARETTLDRTLHHLRSGTQREWSEFPAAAEGREWTVAFTADRPDKEHAQVIGQPGVVALGRQGDGAAVVIHGFREPLTADLLAVEA